MISTIITPHLGHHCLSDNAAFHLGHHCLSDNAAFHRGHHCLSDHTAYDTGYIQGLENQVEFLKNSEHFTNIFSLFI